MAGQVHALIEKLVAERSKGNAGVATSTRTKLLLQGIDASKWTTSSPDDAAMISRVKTVAKDMGVSL